MFCMAREGRSIITQFVSNLISQRQAWDWHVPGKLARGSNRFVTQIPKNLTTSVRHVVHAGPFTATYKWDWNNSRYLTFTDMYVVAKYALAVRLGLHAK